MDLSTRAQEMPETLRHRTREVEEGLRLPADFALSLAEAGFFRMAVRNRDAPANRPHAL